MTRLQRSARLGREAWARARNQATAPRFARSATPVSRLPSDAVAVFFGTGPANLYQFEQWRRPLERLAETRPVFVLVDRPDTGAGVQRSTSLPVAFARGSAALEDLVASRRVRVVLYLNQVESNFRMLRFAGPVHVQVGHGESDKAGSVSNQHKAYDLTFVAGNAGRDRLGAALRGFDADVRTVPVGRPQLDHVYPGAPRWDPGSGVRVWYAPTWEGDRPAIAYSSLASHGVALMGALLAEPGIRVIYRPHPRTGQASEAHRKADREVRDLIERAGDAHLVDDGPAYGWQWGFADGCITDVSAVAYDWLATGKPLVVTEPADLRAYRPPSALLDRLALLPADRAAEAPRWVREASVPADLSAYYFGDVADGASSRRFGAAIDRAYELAGD